MVPEHSSWTKFSVAASGLLAAVQLRSAQWKMCVLGAQGRRCGSSNAPHDLRQQKFQAF
jgi:hypothetical protein